MKDTKPTWEEKLQQFCFRWTAANIRRTEDLDKLFIELKQFIQTQIDKARKEGVDSVLFPKPGFYSDMKLNPTQDKPQDQ